MMIIESVGRVVGMSGEFLSFDCQVVTPGLFSVYTHEPACKEYHICLAGYIKKFRLRYECKIQIAHIVIYCAAPGHTSREIYSVSFDPLHTAFPPWILVFPYDDSMRILPQKQDDLIFFAGESQMLFHSKIHIRIGIVSSVYSEFHDTCPPLELTETLRISGYI